MNRQLGAIALAASTLAVWVVTTSACSGGGGGAPVPSDDVEETSGNGADLEPTASPGADGSTQDGTTTSSPFEPTVTGGSENAPVPPGSTTEAGDEDASPDPVSATDDGPEQQRPIGDGSDTASIAGLWDYTRTSEAGTDVALFAIDAEGEVTEYDFQADAVGTGADCHLVTRSSIASRGNDRYDLQDSSSLPGASSVDDVLIATDGADIVFRYLGNAADPQFGESLAGVEERYPAVTDRRADDLVACDA